VRFRDDTFGDELQFEINVIPLIDVLLVMLIFFMTSASFVASGGLDVKLPQAASQLSKSEENRLAVTVTSQGAIDIDGKAVTLEEVAKIFRSAAGRSPRPLLVLRADEKVEHGVVVRILDEARANGLEELAIATLPRTNQ
jgi:biopolymer transport protein ExbD